MAVHWLKSRRPQLPAWLPSAAAAVWLLFAGWVAAFDYFVTWAQSPDVRGAYQVNTVEMLAYLDGIDPAEPVVLSTVYPGPAHDPSLGLVLAGDEANRRWVDARQALVAPGGQNSTVLIPTATPPHALFAQWLQPRETVVLRPDDLDASFTDFALGMLRS